MSLNTNTTTNTSTTSTNGGGLQSGPVAVEAYSVVLSAAALVLSVVLGGGGSLSVLLAIFQSRRVRKYSYTLVLVFFFLCSGLDLLWSPMELAHLLTYHHTLHNPTTDFGVATFTIYIFLCAGLAMIITAFCVENLLRMTNRFSPTVRNAWPLSVCVAMFLTSMLMAVLFLYASLGNLQDSQTSYLVLHASPSIARVTILTLLVLLVVAGAVAVVTAGVLAIRSGALTVSESFLSANSNNESNNGNAVPRFLINQTGDLASTEDMDKLSNSASSSKLPDIITPDGCPATPIKQHSHSKLGDGPAPGQRGPSMLGVNMAQVLGRRRHTICQIGDSSTPPDPISKAKQYTYVRKFSVDISALQAQLENPKLFKDMVPFTSHQDLRQRQQEQERQQQQSDPYKPKQSPEARGPLQPLSNVGAEAGGGLKLSIQTRPPVITVSEEVREDVEGEIKEEDEEEEMGDDKGTCMGKGSEMGDDKGTCMGKGSEMGDDKGICMGKDSEMGDDKGTCMGKGSNSTTVKTVKAEFVPIMNTDDVTNIARLPVTQPGCKEVQDDDNGEEAAAGGNLCGEDEASYKTSGNRLTDSDQDFVKMTLLMTLTFFLCTFPLFLIEAMKASVNLHTYVNISTCGRALSAIQTIIYPQIVICMDCVVNKAVKRLKGQLSGVCMLREGDCMEMQADHGSSSTSQV